MNLLKKQCNKNIFCSKTLTKKTPKTNGGKVRKQFAMGCLAVLMCGTALFGVACTPATSGAQGASPTSSVDGGASSPTGINTSPFGLKPVTDPVIYTTTSGIDIKFGGATLSSGGLSGFTYFTMGNYNGTDINWVIIGRHSATKSGSLVFGDYPLTLEEVLVSSSAEDILKLQNWVNTYYDNITPQGSAIVNDNINQDVVYVDPLEPLSISLSSKEKTSTTIDNELQAGEVLVISENTILTSHLQGDYNKSQLKTALDNLYTKDLNLTPKQKQLIKPKTLINYFYSSSTTNNAYIFPLATATRSSAQNFCFETYLTATERALSVQYLTRSCSSYSTNSPYIIYATGSGQYTGMFANPVVTNGAVSSYPTRACFVIEIN